MDMYTIIKIGSVVWISLNLLAILSLGAVCGRKKIVDSINIKKIINTIDKLTYVGKGIVLFCFVPFIVTLLPAVLIAAIFMLLGAAFGRIVKFVVKFIVKLTVQVEVMENSDLQVDSGGQ